MRLFKQMVLKLDNKITSDELLNRILQVVPYPEKILFYFAQPTRSRKSTRTDYIKKAYKNHPELEAFLHHKTRPDSVSDSDALSNMIGCWYGTEIQEPIEYIPFTALEEVIKSLSHKYPFHNIELSFQDIDWYGDKNILKPFVLKPAKWESYNYSYCSGSCINWGSLKDWTGKRIISLVAIVEMEVPNNDIKKLPKLPNQVIDKVNILGKIYREKLIVEYDPSEKEEIAKVAIQLNQLDLSLKAKIRYPQNLIKEGMPFSTVETRFKAKELLEEILKPLGYRYKSKLSFPSVYSFTKLTPNSNRIQLLITVNQFHSFFMLECKIEGMGNTKNLHIPYDEKGMNQCHFNNEQHLRPILENCIPSIEYMENHLVPQIDTIMIPTPKWYYNSIQ